jgi:hypothetical protein
VGDHLVSGIERAKRTTGFNVGQTLGQSGVNDAPLLRGVPVVGRGEFRAVNHHIGGDDNFATLESEADQIALGYAGPAPYARGDGNLAFALDFP